MVIIKETYAKYYGKGYREVRGNWDLKEGY